MLTATHRHLLSLLNWTHPEPVITHYSTTSTPSSAASPCMAPQPAPAPAEPTLRSQTTRELFKAAHRRAVGAAQREGRILPQAKGRPLVTTGDIVRAAFEMGAEGPRTLAHAPESAWGAHLQEVNAPVGRPAPAPNNTLAKVIDDLEHAHRQADDRADRSAHTNPLRCARQLGARDALADVLSRLKAL